MNGQIAIDYTAPTVGPYRHGQPSTARAAAVANAPISGAQRHAVLVALVAAGEAGLTAFEAQQATGIKRMHTASTRLDELAKHGLVVRTDVKRPTDTGRLAVVWQATAKGVEAVEAEG